MKPEGMRGARVVDGAVIPLSILLAIVSLLSPIILRWLKVLSPALDQPILLGITMLILPLVWAVSVVIALDRVGWKRARWLLLLAPVGAAWPLVAIWIMAVCIVGRECI